MGDRLAALNALLNGSAALLLVGGRLAIFRKRVAVHRALMLAAFGTSVIFLLSYLGRFYLTGTHRFPGSGWLRATYLAVLFSHMALAALTPLLAIRSLQLALAGQIESHRRLVRFTFPIWMYVSVTGVAIYFMLYGAPGR